MSIESTRAEVMSSIWKAIVQSKVDLSAVPQDQQELLVSKIAENVMLTMDAILAEGQEPAKTEKATDEHGEQIIWEGRPFLSLVEYYILTSERIKIRKGLVGRDIENFELIRVQDIDIKQGVSERLFGIGDIIIHGHDPSDPTITLRNVPKPEQVYEVLRRAWLDARKRYGLQFREFM